MSSENVNPDVKEATEKMEEIHEFLEGISQWCLNNADEAINRLQEDWGNMCIRLKEKSIEPSRFLRQSEIIFQDCVAFRALIIEQAKGFSDKVQNRLPQIKGVTENNDDTASLMDQIMERWNKVEHPQLMFLYEKLKELESIIQDVRELQKSKND